ncbi:MAG: thermonuclease family protein [Alphaproteobacteria bacterium]|nr:thermonuclease family protein [Alphaproteobacteria bacterium]
MILRKIIFTAVASACITQGACAVPAVVRYIVDGDTFSAGVRLEDDTMISVRVRLRNVDTPELHGACVDEIVAANVARSRLAELIPVDSVVELQNIKDDKYLGRIDANVLDSRGRDVGKILVREGLGRAYSGGKRSGWCE